MVNKMSEQKKLIIGRGIFVFIITVLFGLLIVNEKASTILLPKVKDKMNTYINENYKDIINELNIGDVTYKNNDFIMKVCSKINPDYYFLVKYKNKKINDSYQEDYIEGKQLFQKIEKNLETEINNETNSKCEVKIIATLDKFTTKVQERIIKEDNLKELKFYSINLNIEVNSWDYKTITKAISDNIYLYKSKNITPKYYKITITNKNDITQSIEISNITNEFIENQYKEYIIYDIITNNNSQLLQQSKITYKYLN